MSVPEYPFPPLGETQQPAIATPSRYAICIDLDPGVLAQIYGPGWEAAYIDVTVSFSESNLVLHASIRKDERRASHWRSPGLGLPNRPVSETTSLVRPRGNRLPVPHEGSGRGIPPLR